MKASRPAASSSRRQSCGRSCSAAHTRELSWRTPASHSSVGSNVGATPMSASRALRCRSHPQGSILRLLVAAEERRRRASCSSSTRCTALLGRLKWRRRWRAASTSGTSTQSPSSAHRAGRKPRSACKARTAFGGVKLPAADASTKSCSGLKMCSVIRFLGQGYWMPLSLRAFEYFAALAKCSR